MSHDDTTNDERDRTVLPWRKVYPRDRKTDPRRWTLTLEQRGALEELLDAAWLNDGALPADDDVLATLSTAGARWPEIGPPIMTTFFRREGASYVSAELAAEVAEARAYVSEQKRKSALAADARKRRAEAAPADASAGPPPSAVSRQPSDTRDQTTENGFPASDGAGDPMSLQIAAKRTAIAKQSTWTKEACDEWKARYGGTAPGGRIGKAIKPLVAAHGWGQVSPAWQKYLENTEAKYASPQRFADTYGSWSGAKPDPIAAPGRGARTDAFVARVLGMGNGGGA